MDGAGPALREAVLYARVSSKDQEREGFSIPAQQQLLRDYAQEHGIAIVEEFVDVETAKRAGRTRFNAMLRYLKRRKSCRIILVEKTDRLYRNIKDWVYVDELDGVEVHLVKEGTVLSDDSRSSEKFIHGIKVLMAKNFIDNLSEETTKGMEEKCRHGIWPSRAPVGYVNVRRADGKSVIVPDPERAPIIRKLFELYADGECSLTELAQRGHEAGLRSRKASRKVHRGTLAKMLRNPIYMGDFIWKGVRYEGIHEPLISAELFERAGHRLDGNNSRPAQCRRHSFAFTGLVFCGRCETEGLGTFQLVGQIQKGRYIYYHCDECKRRDRVEYIREERIDAQLRAGLKRLRLDETVRDWMTRSLRESHRLERREAEETTERLRAQVDRLQARIDAAYEDRLDGRITPAFFDRKAREWRDEQVTLQRRIVAVQEAGHANMELGIALFELGITSFEVYERRTSSEKRELLDFLCSNCWWDDGTLSIQWRQPYDILAESSPGPPADSSLGEGEKLDFSEWHPQQDSNLRPQD
ncbi:MAG: recombinase family protein [Alphaproteobacteria bacterium]|nr:recombinase family protein [Alphaproteobacteria bacterium]